MMNSQDNSQSSSFDLFSQMMSQQQGLSQQNENAPSAHRFYTKYMSKAPLFPRESNQSDTKNPLPRRRSFQDVQDYNKQRAKDRDDRDLINTFIALVKECADEVKSAADDIKNNVDKNMQESASQSATLMKKLNAALSENYNTLLDSIKEKETEQNKVAELEQALAAKEARIEVLESQLEMARKTKDERVIQSVVDAYAEQQKVNRKHLEKIQEEQQKFTKEQVEIINQKHQDQLEKHQDQIEKSYLVEYSEKQAVKSMDVNPTPKNDIPSATENVTNITSIQQPISSSVNHQQPPTMINNTALHLGVTPVPTAQPQHQAHFVHQTASQKSTCPLPATNYQTCSINDRFSSRCYCTDCEYQIPNNTAVPFQSASIPACSVSASIPTYNINQSMNRQHVHAQQERNMQPQYQQHNTRPNVNNQPLFPQQSAPPTRAASVPVSRNIHSSDAVLYAMTSPISDNPTSILWSRTNKHKPSPVATVAPQVKDERQSPQENYRNEDDILEVDDSTQQSQGFQQGTRAARRQVNEPQPRRSSARVQARDQPSDELPPAAKPKSRQKKNDRGQQRKQQQQVIQQERIYSQQPDPKPQKNGRGQQNKQQQQVVQQEQIYSQQPDSKPKKKNGRGQQNNQQQQVIQQKRIYTQQPDPKPTKTNAAAQRKRKQEAALDVYEFEEDSRFMSVEVPTTKRMKNNTGASQHIQKSYSKQNSMQNDSHRSYPDWVTKPKASTKKSQSKPNQISHQWIVQDASTDDEYEFQDESQSMEESTQEQIVPHKRTFGGNTYTTKVKSSMQHQQSRSKSNFLSYCDDEESSEEITFSMQSPDYPTGKAVYHRIKQETDDFLSTPCLQTVQYDSSEESQLVTGFMSAPGSAVRRKVSRQAERKRRLQSLVRQVDVNHTLAQISKSISKQRQRIKRSGTLI